MKSAIYTANTTEATLAVGDIIPLGTTIRRYGCNLRQDGNAVTTTGRGYYKITAAVTAAPTAAGEIGATLLKDGIAVTGASASATATGAGDVVMLPITAIVRNLTDCDSSLLALRLDDGAGQVTNVAVTVEKL